MKDKAAFSYQFVYEVQILADCRIANLSIPPSAAVVAQNESRTDILIRSEQVSRAINLYYRTADMIVP